MVIPQWLIWIIGIFAGLLGVFMAAIVYMLKREFGRNDRLKEKFENHIKEDTEVRNKLTDTEKALLELKTWITQNYITIERFDKYDDSVGKKLSVIAEKIDKANQSITNLYRNGRVN